MWKVRADIYFMNGNTFWRSIVFVSSPLPPTISPTKYLHSVYRVKSSVWRLPNYWSPTPSLPSECVRSPHQRGGGGVHTRRAVRGGGHISEDARHWIGLLQYNPSTISPLLPSPACRADFPQCRCTRQTHCGEESKPSRLQFSASTKFLLLLQFPCIYHLVSQSMYV